MMAASVCLPLAFHQAHAQSSVTLYGVIDTGIDYVNNSGGSSLVRMRDGTYDGIYGSRWGLRGTEDLGGGLKAVFRLESGFSLENGQMRQGGLEFGRQAYVGLASDHLGTVTVGRQYDSVVDYVQPITFNGQWGGPFVHAGDIDNTANSFRVDNAVKYVSPNLNGLTFGGVYAFSNSNAPGTSTTGMWSAGASYANANLTLGAAYFYAKNPADLFVDGNFDANTSGAAIGASGPFSYLGHPKSQQIFGAGGSYKIGTATLGLDYTHTSFDDANGTEDAVKFDNYEAWGNFQLTAAATVGGVYTFSSGKVDYNGQEPKYHEFGLVGDYKLSKTTEVYVFGAYEKAAGSAKVADIVDGAIASASSTDKQLMVRVGMVHKF
ncbi:porin [Caballeronia sp. LjRoot34]|uniref:porin n=1 Tax=Caballeronia sp. LjRoot34 TaxID=3342325 RepID=UPI003ED13627